MTDATLWQTLISQAPGTAAVIIVVVLFLRAIEKRDELFLEQMQGLTEEMKQIKGMLISHDTRVNEGMESMYREAQKRRRKPTSKTN